MKQHWKAYAVLVGLVVSLLALSFVEIGFRLFTEEPEDLSLWLDLGQESDAMEEAFHKDRLRVHRSDRQLFWRSRPNLDITWRGIRVQTNSLGLRDDEVSKSKAEDEYRILVLGESTTFGDLVEKDQIFSQVLEAELQSKDTRCSFNVINAGVTGYSLFQSYKYLELDGFDLEPDMVMIYHGFNDFLPTAYAAERTISAAVEHGMSDREMYVARSEFPNNINQLLHYNSVAYRWIRGALAPRAGRSADGFTVDRKPRVSQSERYEILSEMKKMIEQHQAEFVILVPVYEDFFLHRSLLVEFSVRTDTSLIDLGGAVTAPGVQPGRAFFPDHLHPRPELHRAFALAILDYIARETKTRKLARCM